MHEFQKKHLVIGIISIAVILSSINLFFIGQRYLSTKREFRELLKERQLAYDKDLFQPNSKDDFFDKPCPEITLISTLGQSIYLPDFRGRVIILGFSRFLREDIPFLSYLQHLADKYAKFGVSLLLVNSLGMYDSEAIGSLYHFHWPIIKDDGQIAAQFGAGSSDVMIVDKTFRLKFMAPLASKGIIYNALNKELQSSIEAADLLLSPNKLIADVSFYDVINNENKSLLQIAHNGVILATLTSTCTGCEENSRIQLLKDLSVSPERLGYNIIILFGKGNNHEAIRRYSLNHEWNKYPLVIGVMEESARISDKEYFSLFKLDVDPKIFIISGEGQLIFEETPKTSRKTDFASIASRLR